MNQHARPQTPVQPLLASAAGLRRNRWPWFAALAAIIGLAAVVLYLVPSASDRRGERFGRRGAGADGPVPVLAVAARQADVPVYIDGVGTTRALNTVTVRPQVDGQLFSVDFREGQDVKRGDVLARIDPRTYQAMLNQALAKKAQDEAQLANAKLTLDRYTKLGTTNAVSRAQIETQEATVTQLEAQVKSDEAAIENAATILSYTTIVAPMEGRAGLRMVDEGNLVRGSDAGLVVLTQLRPIAVFVSLPQQQLGKVIKSHAETPLVVEALDGEGEIIDRGLLTVIDNQVDQTTGTVRLKTEFPNPDLRLWPGAFVNVRLLVETLRNVVVVPTAAVQRGPDGPFVYALGSEETVALRPVTLAYQDDEMSVVGTGLSASERVVTTGFARLSNGAEVSVADTGATDAPRLRDGIADVERQDPGGAARRDRRRGGATQPTAPGIGG